MEIVNISSRYRLAIPDSMRRKLKLRPGQAMCAEVVGDSLCLSPVPALEDIIGIAPGLSYDGVREKKELPAT